VSQLDRLVIASHCGAEKLSLFFISLQFLQGTQISSLWHTPYCHTDNVYLVSARALYCLFTGLLVSIGTKSLQPDWTLDDREGSKIQMKYVKNSKS